jgi:hypothetical protein
LAQIHPQAQIFEVVMVMTLKAAAFWDDYASSVKVLHTGRYNLSFSVVLLKTKVFCVLT